MIKSKTPVFLDKPKRKENQGTKEEKMQQNLYFTQ